MNSLISPLLSKIPYLEYGFFTRNGGVSTGLYSSLNLRSSSADNLSNIKQNRQIVADYFKLSSENLIFLNQQHHNDVHIVKDIKTQRFDGDGLVTATAQIGLCIITADCIPILLADNHKSIVGACHAGWKGALNGVIENTILKMESLGAERKNITASAGASIGIDSYEVGNDFYHNFISKDNSSERFFKTIGNQKHFDLKSYVGNRLKQNQITNIYISKNDTFLEQNNFFSYRRSFRNNEPDYGCQVSVIVIK